MLDVAYGSIRQLSMLALSGIEITAVDVDPLLPVIYHDAAGLVATGKVRILNGHFSADASLVSNRVRVSVLLSPRTHQSVVTFTLPINPQVRSISFI